MFNKLIMSKLDRDSDKTTYESKYYLQMPKNNLYIIYVLI